MCFHAPAARGHPTPEPAQVPHAASRTIATPRIGLNLRPTQPAIIVFPPSPNPFRFRLFVQVREADPACWCTPLTINLGSKCNRGLLNGSSSVSDPPENRARDSGIQISEPRSCLNLPGAIPVGHLASLRRHMVAPPYLPFRLRMRVTDSQHPLHPSSLAARNNEHCRTVRIPVSGTIQTRSCKTANAAR